MNQLSIIICKVALNLASLAALGIAVEGFWDAKFLLEIILIFAATISLAAVMRWRVDVMERQVVEIAKWQKDHDDEVSDYKQAHTELHGKINESLALLRQMADEQHRRVTELEAERWRCGRG